MRIGIDASFLRPESRYTGMGVYTRGLVTGLAALGTAHEIVLLGYGPRPDAAPAGMAWQPLRPLPAGKASLWLSHQVQLPRAARRLGLDVLHIPGVNLRLSQPGVPFCSPCPQVVTLHDAIPVQYYGRQGPPLPVRLRAGYRLAIAAVRRAAAVVTVSETSRRDILACLPVSPERVHVVYNGLDFPPPPPDERTAATLARLGIRRPYLLYAGSYEPRKNILGAIAAYRHALRQRDLPPLVLLVERDSGHRAAVMRAVADSGLSERLVFLHSLSDEDLATVYYAATLFLYPSYYEGFGFAPLQALACRLPVIAACAGSLPEVLGDAAWLIGPDRAEEAADAIVTLLESRERREALAAKGPAQAARYRWETAASQMTAIYEQAAASQPSGRN